MSAPQVRLSGPVEPEPAAAAQDAAMEAGAADPLSRREEEAGHALGRASVYRLLGAAFAYPTAPRLSELARTALQAATAVFPHAARDAKLPLADTLAAFVAAARDADPEAVAAEYVFLFDRQVRCPPYEGAWGETPQMAGKSAQLADIAGFYSAFELTPAGAQPDTEDHIAAELEFMSALAVKEAYALARENADGLEVTRGAQAAFLKDHLGRWAETFAESLKEATPLPYYTAVADLLAAWIRSETEALGLVPARVSACGDLGPLEGDTFSCPMASADTTAEGGDPP